MIFVSEKLNTTFVLVLNPIDPVTGIDVSAGKKHGKKRQRSVSAGAEAADSAPLKKVASNKPKEDGKVYSFKWFAVNQLYNVAKFATWAKYRFRFDMITVAQPATGSKPYLTCEERILLAQECYIVAQTTVVDAPEIGSSFLVFILTPWDRI
jgi:hypothetical protein